MRSNTAAAARTCGSTLTGAGRASPSTRPRLSPRTARKTLLKATPRVGRGLPGMRERAHLAGGWLTAGPDGEHFRVTVFIPF